MSLMQFCNDELDLIGLTADNEHEMNRMMRKHILHMVSEFNKEGHSGMSASYALNILKKLLAYEPLTPLTGNDDEWVNVSNYMGREVYQNKRYSKVFKEGDEVYNIEGTVFWEWQRHDDGSQYRSYYTNGLSRTPVTFPYDIPNKPNYVYRYSDADPPAPKQTKEGIIE
jgi:hypothetical protein